MVISIPRLLQLLLVTSLVALAVTDARSQQVYKSHLSGGSVVPSVPTRGSGDLVAELSGDTLAFSGSFANLQGSLTGARVNMGYAGQIGSTAFDLAVDLDESGRSGTVDPANNRIVLSGAQRAALEERRLYVVVQSSAHTRPELRGQLLPDADHLFESVMSGGESVPSVVTDGWGSVVAELRDSTVTISGSFQGMSTPARTDFFGGAHIHFTRFADSGNNIRFLLDVDYDADLRGGVIRADKNTFEINSWHYGLLLDRQWYADVHSLKWRLQELRGTLFPISDLYFVGRMTGHNVLPPNESGASVGILGELKGDTLTLSGTFLPMDGNVDTLGPSPAHVHHAPAGEVGPIEFPLHVTLQRQNHGHFVPGKNRFVLTDSQIEALLAGELYADVHSTAHPEAGEVRGQILMKANSAAPPAEISSPVSNAWVQVDTEKPTAFQVTWPPAVDRDGDRVIYVWQLSRSAAFERDSLLLSVPARTSTVIELTSSTIDSLLGRLGVEYGQTTTLHHRLVTSDGAANMRGPSRPIRLTRGTISGLPQGDPLSADIDGSALARLNEAIRAGTFSEVHSVLIVRDGKIVHEAYFDGNQDYYDDTYTLVSTADTTWNASMTHYASGVTASVVSALVGIALEEYVVDVERKLVDALPDYAARLTGRELEVSLRHLLTMTAGYQWDENDDVPRMWRSGGDFAAFALDQDQVSFPGVEWNFNSGAPNVLMAVLDELSGNAGAFIKQRLFDPLDISGFKWNTEPGGLPEGATSLFIRPQDLAKLAHLYLAKGFWNGQEIVPSDWVDASLSRIVENVDDSTGYGYLWWARTAEYEQDGKMRQQPYYAAEGDGGNLVALFPRMDMAVVITQGNYGDKQLYEAQNRAILTDYVLPAADARNKMPEVNLSSPMDGERPRTDEPFVISATASDPDGSILGIELLQGSLTLAAGTGATIELQFDTTFSGCYTIVARATDDFGDVGTDFSRIKMGEGCVPGPYALVPVTVPGRVQAELFDVGGPDVAYSDTDRSVNTGGSFRADEGVDIAGDGDELFVTDVRSGEWLTFFLDVAESDDYDLLARTRADGDPGAMQISIDSIFVQPETNLSAHGGPGVWGVTRVGRLYLEAGVHRLRSEATRGGFDLDYITVVQTSVASHLDEEVAEVPSELAIDVYPTPVAAEGVIRFALPAPAAVNVEVFDVQGRLVSLIASGTHDAGHTVVRMDWSRLPAGVYFARLIAGDEVRIRKALVSR